MKKAVKIGLAGWLAHIYASAALAVTSTSGEFKIDLSGMGPWEMRTARASEAISYSTAWTTNALEDANAVVKVYPVKREKPKYIAIDLSGGTAATHYPIEYLEDVPDGGWTDEYKTSKLVLRHIPAGSFIMGGRETDYPGAVNTNLHMVTLTKDFYMGVFEVTQRQWELVMGNRPSWFTNETCYASRPVEYVSYIDIRGGEKGLLWPSSKDVDDGSFMGVLRRKVGLSAFDLPTEAQWEYACRAGTTTALNTGVNLASLTASGVDADSIGRIAYNSGRDITIDDRVDAGARNNDTLSHTAAVGSYPANAWGLHDMHGNVYEWCLDRWLEVPTGDIDPLGATDLEVMSWTIRGGSWFSSGWAFTSGYHYSTSTTPPHGESHAVNTVGFRLCLQGGEIPESTEGVQLVNAAGEGTANWTPTKAGTYYLTHEMQTNGMNGAELLGAWFEVPGPELTFEYDGGPFVGGNVTINGNLDGWTVYYTTDGSTPTAQSTAYTGPFMLPAAATVQAFAVSDGGIVTDVYSQQFDVAEHARIENVRARQRWPWNGKVDIDFDVVGDVTLGLPDGVEVALLVTATNRVAGTNYVASIAALSGDTGTAAGAHRVTWDLNAQGLAFESGDVVFSVGYVEKANLYCVIDLSGGASAASYPVSYLAGVPSGGWTDEYKTTKLVLRRIEAGSFIMGDDQTDETHCVTLTKPFFCGVHEMTQKQYELVTGENPCSSTECGKGDSYPVHWVSYDMIRGISNGAEPLLPSAIAPASFMGKLRAKTGLDLDLPTDAQWEYACRAGTKTSYYWGDIMDGNYAWYNVNSSSMSHEVGTKTPNAWGLYDMSGNVMEWCLDRYGALTYGIDPVCSTGNGGVSRGGDWLNLESACASFGRSGPFELSVGFNNRGFRLAMALASATSEHGIEEGVSYDSVCSAESASVTIDSRVGIRGSLDDETLTYSGLWNGGEGATVTIAQDGVALVEGLTGEGERAWSVTRNGTYVLTHTTYTNGVAGKVETATFVVTGKDVPFAEGDVTVADYSAKYNGAAHGIGVTVADGIENVELKYAVGDGTPTLPWETEPPMLTDVGTMTVWCEISAPGYITQTNSATVTITKRAVMLTSGDASKVYDGSPVLSGDVFIAGDGFVAGEGATFNVTGSQTLVGTSENTFTYTLNNGTKVGNYDITTANGTLTVTKATVGPGGGGSGGGDEPGSGEVPQGGLSKFDKTFVYDGEGHTIDTNSLVAAFGAAIIGEFAVEYATDDGSGANGGPGAPALPWGAVPMYTNAGEYVVWYRVSNPNYNDFVHASKVTITKATVAEPTIEDIQYTGAQIAADVPASELYDVTYNMGGLNVGSYMVMLQLKDAANWKWSTTDADYVMIWYDIVAAANEWIVEPSITGWTYGEAVGTPQAVAKFGTVSVTYKGTAADGTLYDNAPSVTKAGSYRAVFSVAATESYGALLAEVPFTISPRPINPPGGGGEGGASLYVTSFAGVYDGEGHGIAVEARDAGAAAFTIEYAPCPAGPWSAATPLYTNVVSTSIWYRVSAPSYAPFSSYTSVTITERPVTVNIAGHTVTNIYDTTEKTVSGYDATTEDGVYDIAANTIFSGTATAARTDVGTTAMGLTAADFSNNNANFLVTYLVTDGWVKVEPRVIGDNPANWDIRLARNPMYDGTLQTAPITQVAFVKPDGNLDNIPYTLSGNTATDAGNYVVRITGTGNYSGTVEKEWAITPRNVTLTSGSAEWVYDGKAHSETAVTIGGDGFAEGEGATFSGFPVVRHVSDVATPTANVFAYALDANTKAQNYVITTANGTVKMNPRVITLTAPTKSKPYDGTPLTFGAAEVTATLTDGGHGVTALPVGEAFTLSSFASITEAGRVDATFTVADGTALTGDYAITTVPGSLTVTRSATEIIVTAKSGGWTYDGQPHSLHEYEATNLGTLQAGDALEVTFSDESVATTPLDGPEGNGVVANVITGVRVLRNGTDDVTANYTLAPYNGTLTVTRRPVTLTSKSDTKVYDGEPLTAHEVTVGGDGFVGEDGATYDFTGSQTEKGTSKNSFSYTLKSGTNAAYYDITKVEGDLEVTAADISQGNEGDWQIVLGPALTYTGLEQIQTLASVTYKGLPLDYSVTGNAQTDAGTYMMTLTGQGNFSGVHQVAWSIAPKALTLTAGSGNRVYDGTAFTVGSVAASGFVAGEGAEYECTGSQTSAGSSQNEVGTIRWNANTKASNYAVTKVAGTLTVTPCPVTLTAKNITKPYDGTPLALTAGDITANGIVAGESFTYFDFASRTEAGQTPATFSYAAGPGTSLANYAVTVTPGRTITITKSATAISMTAASESWTYDGEAHSNRTWTATNLSTLQAGDELEVTFDESSVATTPQDGPAHDGVVPNTITGVRVIRNGSEDVTANYSVEWFPGTLAVTKRPVTVTVTGRTATYTYDGEEKTVTGYDATTADALYDIAADTAFSGVATTSRTDAGKSNMGLKAGDFTNNDDCFDVTYAVTDGWVKIDPLDIAAAGDGDFVLVLGANPKYNGTVQTIPVESVTCGGLPVTYTLAGENATHAGTYTLTVKANGNFTGERSTTWQILKRAVTLTSGSASKVYDCSPLANPSVAVGGDGFIGLEGATFDVTGSQTVAGTSKNTFAYTLKAGTLAGDYEITKVEGDLAVTPAGINPTDVFGGEGTGDNPLVCEKIYNGATQPVEIVPNFDEPYQFLWALTEGNENAYSATPPTLRNVADGELTVFFKFVTANYQPYYGKVVFRILAKELTDEMVVLSDEAFYYDPGSTVKKPSVTVADTNALGEVISTANDYTVAYENATAAGAIPVTVTAKNNYTGTVTKTFPVLKRPVAPPVIGTKAYNGRTQKATVTTDSRWTVVRNNGGVNVGEYEVVLRLTNTEDYRWKGVDEAEAEWTGVFRITKANNGWSRYPGMTGWTYGETPNEPVMGQARYGAVQVAYRRKGADVSTETATKPSTPGVYIARFWVDETENYIGVAMNSPYEVEFEIYRGPNDTQTETGTTPVPVPYVWLDPYLAKYGSGDYEAAGKAKGRNGCFLWESYVAGLNPEDPASKFTAFIEMLSDNTPKVTWRPDLSNAEKPRKYTVLGKATLLDADWTPVTDANKHQMRFFKVKVEIK